MKSKLDETLRDIQSRFRSAERVAVEGYDIDSGSRETELSAPRLLFRGKANATWDSMVSSLERLRSERLSDFEKGEIAAIASTVDQHLQRMLHLAPQALAGFLQHYGFPTELIDVSSSPQVAALFAVWGNLSGSGAITVFGTLQVTRNCTLIDLTVLEWALRPPTQAGYGVFHDTFTNLWENASIVDLIQCGRFEFPVVPSDAVRFLQDANATASAYIDLLDPARAMVGHLLTALTRNDGPFPGGVAKWFATRVPPSTLTVVDYSANPPSLITTVVTR